MSPDSIIREIVSACIQRLPRDERPSPDKIARYPSVAAIARDFIGLVSTEPPSFEHFLSGTRQTVAPNCVGPWPSSLGLPSTPFHPALVASPARCPARAPSS